MNTIKTASIDHAITHHLNGLFTSIFSKYLGLDQVHFTKGTRTRYLVCVPSSIKLDTEELLKAFAEYVAQATLGGDDCMILDRISPMKSDATVFQAFLNFTDIPAYVIIDTCGDIEFHWLKNVPLKSE